MLLWKPIEFIVKSPFAVFVIVSVSKHSFPPLAGPFSENHGDFLIFSLAQTTDMCVLVFVMR